MYRIKDINGENFRVIFTLNDGTYMVRALTKDYIIYIFEDQGYQVLYEANIPPIFLQTHDEKLITRNFKQLNDENKESEESEENNNITYLGLFEKDENGIYRKKKEIISDYFEQLTQIKDNLMVTKTFHQIIFYKIDSLEIIKKINYDCPRATYHLALLSERYLLIPSNFFKRNMFALVDMEKYEVKEFLIDEEIEYEEYYKKHPYENRIMRIPIVIRKIDYFPDGSFLANLCYFSMFGRGKGSYLHLKWDNEKEKLIKLNDITGLLYDGSIEKFIVLDDNYTIVAQSYINLFISENR